MELKNNFMKRSNNNLTHSKVIINRQGQLSINFFFFLKNFKKFYRFTIFELF